MGRETPGQIAFRISETLKESEAALLIIREGHSVQFPSDIEVFSVAPPVLDEIHRWMREESGKANEPPLPEEGHTEGPASQPAVGWFVRPWVSWPDDISKLSA